MNNPLLNAPPRLSDLRGEKRAIALRDRHEANKARWLESRRPRPLLARLLGRTA
jgi:hypothetical protein